MENPLAGLPAGHRAALVAGAGVAGAALLLYLLSRQASPSCGLSCAQGRLVRLSDGSWDCAFSPSGSQQCLPTGTTDPAQLRYLAQPGSPGLCVSNQPGTWLQGDTPPDCGTIVGSAQSGPYQPTSFGGKWTCCASRGGGCFYPAAAAVCA